MVLAHPPSWLLHLPRPVHSSPCALALAQTTPCQHVCLWASASLAPISLPSLSSPQGEVNLSLPRFPREGSSYLQGRPQSRRTRSREALLLPPQASALFYTRCLCKVTTGCWQSGGWDPGLTFLRPPRTTLHVHDLPACSM